MYARDVDDVSTRLRELRHARWEDFGLGALTLALSIAATQLVPALALPLFVGGIVVGVLGMKAHLQYTDLVDELADQRDAYVIPEVLRYASREATMRSRHSLAVLLRTGQLQPRVAREVQAAGVADELEALATELEDRSLALDPACAMACRRLVVDLADAPVLDRVPQADGLRARVRRIRSGFSRRELVA